MAFIHGTGEDVDEDDGTTEGGHGDEILAFEDKDDEEDRMTGREDDLNVVFIYDTGEDEDKRAEEDENDRTRGHRLQNQI